METHVVFVGASTAAAVDTAARGVEGERREQRRGVGRVVRSGEKEEMARGRMEAGGKGRCHSCGRREATEAAGLGILASPGGGGGRSRGSVLRFWAFGVEIR